MKYIQIQPFNQILKLVLFCIVFILAGTLSSTTIYAQTPLSIHTVIDIANPVQPKITSLSYEWSFPPKSSTMVEGSYYEITLLDENDMSLFSTRYPKKFISFGEGAPDSDTTEDIRTLDLMLPYEKNAKTIALTDNTGAKLLSTSLEAYKPTIPPSPPPAFDLGKAITTTPKAKSALPVQSNFNFIALLLGIVVVLGTILILKRRKTSY